MYLSLYADSAFLPVQRYSLCGSEGADICMPRDVRVSGYLQTVVLYAGLNISIFICFLLGQLQCNGQKLFSLLVHS